LYDNVEADAIDEDDLLLMDSLMRNKEIQAYLASKLG
jgi:hypothetical protein